MESALKRIGILFSTELGLTRSISAIGRILLGILAGLPPTALAVSSTIAFTVSAVLEFPTGLITDLFGKVRASIIGYLFQAAACTSLFFALFLYKEHPQLMWFLIILEALLDAAGNAFASGSLEALYQEIIIKESAGLPDSEAKKFRETGLLQAEGFGRYIAFISPITGITAALLLKSYFNFAHILLLFHAFGWIVVSIMIFKLANQYQITDLPKFNFHERLENWRAGFKDLFYGHERASIVGMIGALGMFMNASVECYYFISVLREIQNNKLIPFWVPTIIITLTAALGQLLRSFALPAFSKKYPNIILIILGLLGQTLLSVVMIAASEFLIGNIRLLVLLVYPILFALSIGFINRPALGMLLADTKPYVHATAVSLRTTIALLLLGTYSFCLSMRSGAPSISWIMLINIGISSMMASILVFRFKRKTNEAI